MFRYANSYFKLFLLFLMLTSTCAFAKQITPQYTRTQQTSSSLSPEQVLVKLQKGNERFLSGKMQHRNYNKQAYLTSTMGQAPYAVILSCMDSRGPAEIILDQGIGDIFSLRVAGNVLNQDIVGSMEYATKVIGSKVIVIMGHSQCGAVEAACKSTKLGNLTSLLNQIQPAVKKVTNSSDCSAATVDKIARQNVTNMTHNLRSQSSIIDQLVKNKELLIIGAMQDLNTGKVVFFESE